MDNMFRFNLSKSKLITPEEYADKLFEHLSKDSVKLIRLSQTMWLIPSKDKLVKEIIIREKVSNYNLECFLSKFEERFESKLKGLYIVHDPFTETNHFSDEGICLKYTEIL